MINPVQGHVSEIICFPSKQTDDYTKYKVLSQLTYVIHNFTLSPFRLVTILSRSAAERSMAHDFTVYLHDYGPKESPITSDLVHQIQTCCWWGGREIYILILISMSDMNSSTIPKPFRGCSYSLWCKFDYFELLSGFIEDLFFSLGWECTAFPIFCFPANSVHIITWARTYSQLPSKV